MYSHTHTERDKRKAKNAHAGTVKDKRDMHQRKYEIAPESEIVSPRFCLKFFKLSATLQSKIHAIKFKGDQFYIISYRMLKFKTKQ